MKFLKFQAQNKNQKKNKFKDYLLMIKTKKKTIKNIYRKNIIPNLHTNLV